MPAREGRHHHRVDRDRGQENDVDLRVAEDPEEVLPEQRIPSPLRIEERPVEQPFHFEKYVARDERRKGEQDHDRDDEDVPRVQRHQVEPHSGRPAFQNTDDELHRGGDRRNFDEGQSQHPDVRANAGKRRIGGERWIHEPSAVGSGVEENRASHEYAAEQETPVAECRETGKRQVARTQQLRQDQDRNRFEHRHGEQEHHHRAVQREELVERRCRDEVVVRNRELCADDQREHAREQHHHVRGDRVPGADPVVVRVSPPQEQPRRGLPGRAQALLQRRAHGRIVLVRWRRGSHQ